MPSTNRSKPSLRCVGFPSETFDDVPSLSSFLSVGRFLALLGTVLIALSDDPLEALRSAVDTFVGTTLPTVVTVGW